jgi:GT2 family glycosyltransferase
MSAPLGFGIVTRNRATYLRDCLVSIDASARAAALGQRVPVAVLDNSDDDDTRYAVADLAARLPALELRYARTAPTPTLLSEGRNACVAALATELVAFVDDDTVLAAGWIEACLAAFLDPAVAAVTGRIIEPGTEQLDPDADLPIGRILPAGHMTDNFYLRRAAPIAVQHVRGCNWACRRVVFESSGGFASEFEHVYEEADLSLRMSRAGHRILFVPGVEVVHRCGPRAHPLRQDDPRRYFERTRTELAFYTLLLVRGFGPGSATFWRFLLTRETGLHALVRAPSRMALREVVNNAAGKALGLARALRGRAREARLGVVRFEQVPRSGVG